MYRKYKRLPEMAAAGAVAAPGGRARRLPLTFAIVTSTIMMMGIDSTIVATALSAVREGLQTSINWAGWTITAYLLAFVVMLPISGKLCMRHGHFNVFMGSVATFTIASLACGLSGNIYTLITFRALQALGGAGFMPSATGIVIKHFGSARDRAVGLFGSVYPIGVMIGPIFGGLFVTYWNWRGIFLVNVPIGLAVMLLAMHGVPRDRPRKEMRVPLDGLGMVLLAAGLATAMFAASYLGEADARPASAVFILPCMIAVACLLAFVRHIHRNSAPIIPPRLIFGKGFGAVNLVNGVFVGLVDTVIALLPLYAINRYHLDVLDSGLLLIAQGAAAIVFAFVSAMLMRRTGYRLPVYVAVSMAVLGIAWLVVAPPASVSPGVWLACGAFLIGVAGGTMSPPTRSAGLQLEPDQSATIAGLRVVFIDIGTIISVSIGTALIAHTNSPGLIHAWFYAGVAAAMLLALPSVHRMPEHYGSW